MGHRGRVGLPILLSGNPRTRNSPGAGHTYIDGRELLVEVRRFPKILARARLFMCMRCVLDPRIPPKPAWFSRHQRASVGAEWTACAGDGPFAEFGQSGSHRTYASLALEVAQASPKTGWLGGRRKQK